MLEPVQIAYHVDDPASAARDAAEAHGWGPFYVIEHVPLSRCVYRGEPGRFDHTSAYGQAGGLMVEFLTQHDLAPSAVRDLYRPGERGVHHVAHFVADLAVALQGHRRAGVAIAMEAATREGVEFAMVDTSGTLGHMLELYEPGPALTQFYAYVRRKADGWDGTNPVRLLKV